MTRYSLAISLVFRRMISARCQNRRCGRRVIRGLARVPDNRVRIPITRRCAAELGINGEQVLCRGISTSRGLVFQLKAVPAVYTSSQLHRPPSFERDVRQERMRITAPRSSPRCTKSQNRAAVTLLRYTALYFHVCCNSRRILVAILVSERSRFWHINARPGCQSGLGNPEDAANARRSASCDIGKSVSSSELSQV